MQQARGLNKAKQIVVEAKTKKKGGRGEGEGFSFSCLIVKSDMLGRT